jgi:PST family polysaccharide transporter
VINLGNQAARFLLRMAGTVVLARLLSPADFGVVAMVGSLVGFVALLREFGLSMAIVQRPNLGPRELNAVFWVNLSLGLAVSLILLALAPAVGTFYGRPEAADITRAFAAMGLVGSLGTQHYALLQREMRFGSIAARDLLASVVALSAGIAAAAAGLGFWALVIMEGAGTLAGTAFLWWRSEWRPGVPKGAPGLRSLLRFGGALTVSNLLTYANHNLDNILLGRFLGDAAVGFYSRAQALLNRPLEQVLPPVMSVALPMLSRLVPDPARFRRATLQLVELACFAGCFLSLVLIPSADWFVQLLLGPQWAEAIPVFRVLCVFGLLEPMAWLLGLILVAHGQPGAMAHWRAVTFVVVAAAFAAGLPWGVLGVAAGYMLSGVVTRVWLVFFVARRVGLPAREFLTACAPFVLTAGTIAAGVWLARAGWEPSHAVWGLAVVVPVQAACYLAALAAFARGRRFLVQLLELARETLGKR